MISKAIPFFIYLSLSLGAEIIRHRPHRLPRKPIPLVEPQFNFTGSAESPKLSYRIGNGSLRRVHLEHYDPLRLSSREILCHYIGTQTNSPVVIGVTGCPGETNVQITFISGELKAQYLLNKDKVLLRIQSPFGYDGNSSSRSAEITKTQMENDAIFVNQIEHSAVVASLQCSETDDCHIPSLHKMTIKIGYDATLAEKEPNTLHWISGVMTHTQTFFYDPSLPTKIQIEVLGAPKHYANSKWKAESSITTVEQYARGDTSTDLYVFLCADSNLYGTVGIAYVGGLCDTNGYQVSINEWRSTEAETAKVVAHEIGHNMGMSHDFDPNHTGKECTGIMDYGETSDTWSLCSQDDFRNHYFGVKNSEGDHCLEILSDNSGITTSKSQCKTPSFNGDGYCDDENNNVACGFDGGDCCNPVLGDWDIFCSHCECIHPEGGCEASDFIGDGYCDDENNNPGCGFDGGDCCLRAIKQWDFFCQKCDCKSP